MGSLAISGVVFACVLAGAVLGLLVRSRLPAARRYCIREARAAAAVCHDHVVAVHGVHETDALPYLVMQ